MNEFNLQADMKSIVQTVCTTQVDKTDKTRRFATAMGAESQGYRHVLNRTFYNGVGDRTKEL